MKKRAEPKVGELFLLGFRGASVPAWLRKFEAEFGLGGVILFDVDVEQGLPVRNIAGPEQLRTLCREIHQLPSRPLVFVDQEGGHVRRLKSTRGFAPLPSAAEFNDLPEEARYEIARISYREMAKLGVDFNLAPVVDLNTNPRGPIAKQERSFSDDPEQVRRNVAILSEVATETGLRLCLKHFPGLGGAATDTHHQLTDLTGRVSEEQLRLFVDLWPTLPGGAVLLSHGILREWDEESPVSVSEAAVAFLRGGERDALLITDDLQMRGMQVRYGTVEASLRAVRAGVDLCCIANNERAQERECAEAAREIARCMAADPTLSQYVEGATERVRARKQQRP